MKRFVMTCAALGLFGPAAWAGVVMQMEVVAPGAPDRTGSETFYAQGEMTRMDSPAAGGSASSVIFRDQTMYLVDHGKKVCSKIDKESVDQLSRQLDAVMKQMASLPPEQRAMMEKMMQGRMPGASEPPQRRVEAGGTEQVGDYTCAVYTLYSDDKKVSDVCMADKSAGEGLAEAMEAVHALSRFAEGLMKVAQNMPLGRMMEIPYQEIHEMEGFPVRTRHFDDKGEVQMVRTLKSVARQEIEPGVFAIPEGYKVRSMEKELQKGR